MEAGEDDEEYSGGISSPDFGTLLIGDRIGEPQDDPFQEGEEITTPDLPKKTRPPRACDFCRRKKVPKASSRTMLT